jgi:D-alanyl-D-alanine carboxypeptidase/D-alanyl-D-alanine-endopeptidase (penicillin-binding protein 4)
MKIFSAYAVLLLWTCLTMSAQTTETHPADKDLQAKIEALISDATFEQAVVGISACTADGRPLAGINGGTMLVPASNMKLISTGAALHALGPDYRYETRIGYSGTIEDGTLKGNLYIIGGGDPTTASKDSIAMPAEATFAEWESLVRKAGIRRIEGRIVGDGRHFEGMAEEPSWLWNDIGTYYGAGATGLMFYENMMSFSVAAGPEPGSAISIKPYYPETPWMEFRYSCSTGKTGTGDNYADNWFVGVTPAYSCAVWHGQSDSNRADNLFAAVVGGLYGENSDLLRNFITHENLNQIAYCARSGHAFSNRCTRIELGYYKQTDALPVCSVCGNE